MKYIKTDESNRVVLIHHQEKLLKDKTGFFAVDEVPEPTPKDGKISILNYTESRGFWTEYKDKPLTELEQIKSDVDYLILKQEGLI